MLFSRAALAIILDLLHDQCKCCENWNHTAQSRQAINISWNGILCLFQDYFLSPNGSISTNGMLLLLPPCPACFSRLLFFFFKVTKRKATD